MDAPWSYGDFEVRKQKKILERKNASEVSMSCILSKENELSKGATGTVYGINDNEVIKVYPEGYDVKRIEEEFYKSKIIYDF